MAITRIVITGGPCGGKTTLLEEVKKEISVYGYRVICIFETATELIQGGIAPWNCSSPTTFQKTRMLLQKNREEIYESALCNSRENILIVCDRGMMDSLAYMEKSDFLDCLSEMGMSEITARDRYDGVFHLESAAVGALESYTLSNNSARTEDAKTAAELDMKVMCAWVGAPHLRCIKAEKSLEKKKESLISEIKALLGIPRPLETERKFLIEYPDKKMLEKMPECKRVFIAQTYLEGSSEEERRVRKRGDGEDFIYYYTEKKKISSAVREEKERQITKAEYESLLKQADGTRRTVEKDRYCLMHKGQYFEIDVYPCFKDIAIMEIELSDESRSVEFPGFLKVIKEVTGDEKYKNSTIAKK